MALSANKQRYVQYTGDTHKKSFPLASAVELYEGALVGITTAGYAKEASTTLRAVGIARTYKANSSSTAVTTENTDRVQIEYGQIERISKSNASVSMIGKTVYATADDAVSTAGSSLHAIGTVVGAVSSTYLEVRINTLGI